MQWLLMLCGRLFISVSRFIVNYSNLSLLEWVDILLSRSYNKRNRRPVLVLKLSYSLHTQPFLKWLSSVVSDGVYAAADEPRLQLRQKLLELPMPILIY